MLLAYYICKGGKLFTCHYHIIYFIINNFPNLSINKSPFSVYCFTSSWPVTPNTAVHKAAFPISLNP